MSIKLLFHIFAGIAGIVAAIFIAIPSNNRIVLFVVFALIALIFESAIPFLKLPQIEIPQLTYSITNLPSNYAEGLEIDGVKWEKDFREYFLRVRNKSKNTEIQDLRIDMDVAGGIVKHTFLSQRGCENVTIPQNFLKSGIEKRGIVTRTFESYSNNLKINAVKMYPESFFEIKLIVKTFPTAGDSGFFEIEYRYLDAENKTVRKSSAYKILVKNEISKSLYIDTKNPITGQHKRSMMFVPEKPLIYKKNGSVEIKKE